MEDSIPESNGAAGGRGGLMRSLWIFFALLVAIFVAIGLRIGLPIYRNATGIWEIERVGGRIGKRESTAPKWVRDLIGEDRAQWSDKILVVNLDGTPADDRSLKCMKAFSSLDTLYLRDTRVTDAGLHYLGGCIELQALDLAGTQVTDSGLLPLSEMRKLRLLYLNDARITDAGLEPLKHMQSLRELYLSGTEVTVPAIDELKKSLPDLQLVEGGIYPLE